MLNQDVITKRSYGSPVQILANVQHQYSVGCRVPKSLGVDVGDGIIIAKAGTPIKVDFGNTLTAVQDGASGGNAVLLHNVDVTKGEANGTALVWGFVNVNRLEDDVKAKVTAGTKIGDVQFVCL